MSYKPLTNEELTSCIHWSLGNRSGKAALARVFEQALRANRLAYAVEGLQRHDPNDCMGAGHIYADLDEALVSYRGDK